MTANLYPTTWSGMPALALEDNALRVIVLPELGAKIASLYDKRAGYEWLLGPGDRPVRPVPYGARFIDQDMSGWDECFPTIDACAYPAPGPLHGRALPDHGEVWALAWETMPAPEGVLRQQVAGRALPYRLEREMALPEPGRLTLHYSLTNLGEEPYYTLWAAHPQFAVGPGTEIVLPPEVDQVFNIIPDSIWGAAGDLFPWPEARATDGSLVRLDRCGPPENKVCRKFYVRPEQPVAWASVVDRSRGLALRLSWDPAKVPYLGIWVDEGAVNSQATLALEPCTAFRDNLPQAWQAGRAPLIGPGECQAWEVLVEI